uniref:Uncharacterized protein n=1 Tax=Knipowitschia caucasica TaxID=637954 RepID=A0AAV2KZY4_KNICA
MVPLQHHQINDIQTNPAEELGQGKATAKMCQQFLEIHRLSSLSHVSLAQRLVSRLPLRFEVSGRSGGFPAPARILSSSNQRRGEAQGPGEEEEPAVTFEQWGKRRDRSGHRSHQVCVSSLTHYQGLTV